MIDAHLHLQDSRLSANLPEILRITRQIGVQWLVVNGTHPGDWDAVRDLSEANPEVIPCYGLHPWWVDAQQMEEGWIRDLEQRLISNPRAGIGEIGLDRGTRGRKLDWSRQRDAFRAQLDLANQLDRPVSIHCVSAWGTLFDLLQTVRLSRPPLLHAYGGPVEMLDDFLQLGAFFSISGAFFRPERVERLAVFDRIPDSRLLIETDSPNMLPSAGMIRYQTEEISVNHPGNLFSIYAAVAQRRGSSIETLERQISDTFAHWYSLGGPSPRSEFTSSD